MRVKWTTLLGSPSLQSCLHQERQKSRGEGAPTSPGQHGGGRSLDIQEGPLTSGHTVHLPPRSRSLHQEGHRRSGRPMEGGFYQKSEFIVQNSWCMAIRNLRRSKLSRDSAPLTATPRQVHPCTPQLWVIPRLFRMLLSPLLTSLLREQSGQRLVRTQEKGAVLLPRSYTWALWASKEIAHFQKPSQM